MFQVLSADDDKPNNKESVKSIFVSSSCCMKSNFVSTHFKTRYSFFKDTNKNIYYYTSLQKSKAIWMFRYLTIDAINLSRKREISLFIQTISLQGKQKDANLMFDVN